MNAAPVINTHTPGLPPYLRETQEKEKDFGFMKLSTIEVIEHEDKTDSYIEQNDFLEFIEDLYEKGVIDETAQKDLAEVLGKLVEEMDYKTLTFGNTGESIYIRMKLSEYMMYKNGEPFIVFMEYYYDEKPYELFCSIDTKSESIITYAGKPKYVINKTKEFFRNSENLYFSEKAQAFAVMAIIIGILLLALWDKIKSDKNESFPG